VKIQLKQNYNNIISLENLLEAWKEFIVGKKNRKDAREFSMRLMDNIFSLNNDLINHTYKHGGYQAFKINCQNYIEMTYRCVFLKCHTCETLEIMAYWN
jgi:hypothetical protein